MHLTKLRRTAVLASLMVPLVLASRPLLSADPVKDEQVHSVRLTNRTEVTGRIEHQDKQRLRLRTKEGFAITIPRARIHTLAKSDGSDKRVLSPLLPEKKRNAYKTIALSTEHTLTIRKNPTTQVHIRIAEWPDQTFLLWFPEVIDNVWAQWDAEVAKQDFTISAQGALIWQRRFADRASVLATMTPGNDSVFLATACIFPRRPILPAMTSAASTSA